MRPCRNTSSLCIKSVLCVGVGFVSLYKRLYPLIVIHAHYDVIRDEIRLGWLFVHPSATVISVTADVIFDGMMCLNHVHGLAFAELYRVQICLGIVRPIRNLRGKSMTKQTNRSSS